MEQSYKEKYEDILARLERAKNDNDVCDERFCCVIDDLIPELAESEDEKVKNKLINLIKMSNEAGGFALHKWEADEMLTWLEKQGKKLSIWTDNDRIMAFTLLRDVDQMTYISDEGKNERLQWLNSLEDKFNNGE